MKAIYKIAGVSLLLVLFAKCNNTGNTNKSIYKQTDSLTNCDTILKGKKYKEKQIPVYKIDASFYSFLDTIIKAEKECPYYKQCMSGFSITTLRRTDYFYIEVNTANIYFYDYSKCYGLFEYNGVRFICDSLYLKDVLQKTTEFISVHYVDLDRSKQVINYDDRYSSWYFEYRNKRIKLTGKHLCFNP